MTATQYYALGVGVIVALCLPVFFVVRAETKRIEAELGQNKSTEAESDPWRQRDTALRTRQSTPEGAIASAGI